MILVLSNWQFSGITGKGGIGRAELEIKGCNNGDNWCTPEGYKEFSDSKEGYSMTEEAHSYHLKFNLNEVNRFSIETKLVPP